MKIKITCDYPKEKVRELAIFASKGINTAHITLWIKNSRYSYAGRAYCGSRHVSARIGHIKSFPITVKYPRRKRAPEYQVFNWKEVLVMLVAHELRHIQQYQRRKPLSEVDAERWAHKRVLAFRDR